MVYKNFDGKNANLTLGIELIDTNRQIKFLLANCTDINNIRSIRMIIDWEDGLLQDYRKYMKIEFYNPEKKCFTLWNNYKEAMTNIQNKLLEKEPMMEEEIENRMEYVFWLNRWSELLESCFKYLNLVPVSTTNDPDESMLMYDEDDEDDEANEPDKNVVGYTFPTQ